ncbi:MAG: hypothetical protein ACRCXT_21170 [Paraclostridium sp.]
METIQCKECGGTMLLQENICGEELYSCQNCRLDLYVVTEQEG